MEKRYWSREEVAKFLRVTRMTLSRWEKAIPLPRDYMGCRLKMMSEKEILAWHEKLSNKINMKQDFIRYRRERGST